MKKTTELYRGKAKTVFKTDDENVLILHFRDDTSAFDGEKVEQLARKGRVNNHFNAFIMQKLSEAGVATHFIELLNDQESLVKHLKMIPLECVVRNYAAGSICRRLGVEQGMALQPPTFEFFLKNDPLHDPMVNESHVRTFGWATEDDLVQMEKITMQVNQILTPLFKQAGMLLVDYKLEFGHSDGQMLLGDEFTPDGCRLWDIETKEPLDKDRFRKDLGDVVESYELVAKKLGISL